MGRAHLTFLYVAYGQPIAVRILCEALVNCVACAAVSLLAWRNCLTTPSNTCRDAQAIWDLLLWSATLATSKGALSTSLTAVGTGKFCTVASQPIELELARFGRDGDREATAIL